MLEHNSRTIKYLPTSNSFYKKRIVDIHQSSSNMSTILSFRYWHYYTYYSNYIRPGKAVNFEGFIPVSKVFETSGQYSLYPENQCLFTLVLRLQTFIVVTQSVRPLHLNVKRTALHLPFHRKPRTKKTSADLSLIIIYSSIIIRRYVYQLGDKE